MHFGASVRELYGGLAFYSTTFSHLHTPHVTIVSFPDLPHAPPTLACKTTGEKCLRKRLYVGYQIYAGVCGAIKLGYMY